MNVLFWNVNKKPLNELLAEMVCNLKIDVLALAEYDSDSNDLLKRLDSIGLNFFSLPNIGCERIHLFTCLSPGAFHIRRESDHYSIREFIKDGHLSLLMLFAHLPSKKDWDEDDQASYAVEVRLDIEAAETDTGNGNTLILGDLNMNPFERGIVSAGAFNAVSCLRTASRGDRKVKKRPYKFFYNPMWNVFGDGDGVPGSYFHASPGFSSHYWNLYDQVLLRPGIADRLDSSTLRFITQVGRKSLVGARGRPSVSDHLPLFFSFDSLPQRTV